MLSLYLFLASLAAADPPKDVPMPVCPKDASGVQSLVDCARKLHQLKNSRVLDRFRERKKSVMPTPPCNTSDPYQSPNSNFDLENLQYPKIEGSESCSPGMVLIRDVGPMAFTDVFGAQIGKKESVAAFCVDQYEAFMAEMPNPDDSKAKLKHWSPFFKPKKGSRYKALSFKGTVPQGYVNRGDSDAACKNAGKRLCKEREWRRACGGPKNTTYPYGKTAQPGWCNDSRDVWAPEEAFPKSYKDAVSKGLQSVCTGQVPDTVERTGGYPNCKTEEGVYDMMGNLEEWIDAPHFVGGYYGHTSANGPGCVYKTTAHSSEHFDYSTGFRCCAEPRAN